MSSRRRRLVALALAALGFTALASTPANALPTPAKRLISHLPLVGPSLDFGCANPANTLANGLTLAGVRVHVGDGLRCFGRVLRRAGDEGPRITSGPTGYGPAQIQAAYKLAGLHASGRTVAIVDAFNDPRAETDLSVYRSAYGLPACTTAGGCFRKVNQAGASAPLPPTDYGWSEEISLDLDAVSAACPDCHILLVEANAPDDASLSAAEDTAARAPGVVAISNSFGGAEDSTITSSDVHFHHAGVAITASSGDGGYGVSWPASSPYVTAVGGTTLSVAAGARGWSETAWSGSGSGCSAYEPKPAWQHDTGCPKRTVADVSADADPTSGLGVYDTANDCGSNIVCDVLISLGVTQGLDGWVQVAGTSLSSPLIASTYALAGNSSAIGTGASHAYARASSLFDVVAGSNGSCSTPYLCTAGAGYDGPTGLGTPNGIGGF